MPASLDFSGGRIIDPTKGLRNTLGDLSNQVLNAEALALREERAGREKLTFDQTQADRLLAQKVGAVDTTGIGTTELKFTPTTVDMTPAEQEAVRAQASLGAEQETLTGAPAFQSGVDKLLTEREKVAGKTVAPASKSAFSGLFPTSTAYDKVRPYNAEDQKQELAGFDTRLEQMGADFSKKYSADQAQGLANLSDKDFKKAGKSLETTVAKDRASYVKELRAAYTKQVGENPDTATKAAINKAIEAKLVPFDKQTTDLKTSANALKIFKSKADYKSELSENLAIVKQTIKKKFEGDTGKKGDVSQKDIAAAKGLVEAYGDSFKWAFGFGMSDEEEANLAEAKAIVKQGFKQETRK